MVITHFVHTENRLTLRNDVVSDAHFKRPQRIRAQRLRTGLLRRSKNRHLSLVVDQPDVSTTALRKNIKQAIQDI